MANKERYIEKFKKLYEVKTGNILSDDDALSHFENLVALVGAIYQPISKDSWGKITKN
jgi:hypothetical protein